jgi:hypothetical protein
MSLVLRAVPVMMWLVVGDPFGLLAQTTSTLSGRVTDATTAAPLVGATVQLFLTDTTTIGTTTDATGAFRLIDVPTGIHRVRAGFVGYAASEVDEVWVRLGKEEVMNFPMQRSTTELGTLEVRATVPQRMKALGMHTLTVEQSLRYPATFFDPARLAMSYAGVASANDQANHFSVRGNGPMNNAWLWNGAEIVSPNHLTNAGTASDLPTLSGGGTTILSAQMLGTSHMLMGVMSAPYGNALGGVMDLRSRPGDPERQAFTIQAGLIGLDLSTEGPFRKGGRSSYLINYRYSTLGLLGAMGVALGDEAISFQDLSFNVNVPLDPRTELSFFGMGGTSSNRFMAKDSIDREFDKDSQNIDYTALVGAAGFTFDKGLGRNCGWRTTAVISANDQERVSERTDDLLGSTSWNYRDTASLREQKLSVVSVLNMQVGERTRVALGGSAMERLVGKQNTLVHETTSGWLMRPFARMERSIGQRVQLDMGLAFAHWTPNGSSALEPRMAVRYLSNDRNTIGIGAGQRSQLPAVQNYALFMRWFAETPILPTDNSGIGLLRSQDVEITYEHRFTNFLEASVSGFVQRLLDVPVGDAFAAAVTGSGYSLLNEWDALTVLPLTAEGEGFNAGGQVSVERTMHRNFFYQVNATLFNATYSDRFAETFNSRWNTGVIANAVLGREYVKEKEDRKRTWGVNGRLNFTGGQHYTPRATFTGEAVEPFSAQLEPTVRLDLRVYLKRERKAHTGMWSLDLLNATNARNEAYRYYDQRKGDVVTKYQLGLIPNLSYRIEFRSP